MPMYQIEIEGNLFSQANLINKSHSSYGFLADNQKMIEILLSVLDQQGVDVSGAKYIYDLIWQQMDRYWVLGNDLSAMLERAEF